MHVRVSVVASTAAASQAHRLSLQRMPVRRSTRALAPSAGAPFHRLARGLPLAVGPHSQRLDSHNHTVPGLIETLSRLTGAGTQQLQLDLNQARQAQFRCQKNRGGVRASATLRLFADGAVRK
eukprot:2830583-Rhodomonas_salina.1